jgi:(4-(4-[2-(gamma-L-glutamylamino)ethyl]phenoxymethyl)furan-2-yl)methanamine synthase
MRMKASVIGLDIGGANLKAARSNGEARSRPFELWKHPERLAESLRELIEGWPAERFAITMTGELCDCFETKRDGARHILAEVERAFPNASILVWSTAGRFLNREEARRETLAVSAANWHALATYCGQQFAQTRPALLIDVGSTTTDIIPMFDGLPRPIGRTDPERLESSELIYTGVRRTPICALLQKGIAAELFATMLDANLMLGNLPDDPDDCGTADGRPATRQFAHARLARMLGGDPEITSKDESARLASIAHGKQRRLLIDALQEVAGRMSQPPQAVVLAGSGEFLARHAWNDCATSLKRVTANPLRVISLADELGPAASAAACAHAVAVLAERT